MVPVQNLESAFATITPKAICAMSAMPGGLERTVARVRVAILAKSLITILQLSADLRVSLAHALFQADVTVLLVTMGSTAPCVCHVTSYLLLILYFAAIFCDTTFLGGSWALVRHAPQGSRWHIATFGRRAPPAPPWATLISFITVMISPAPTRMVSTSPILYHQRSSRYHSP